ncbi:MAG: pyridoxal phosphate-dependent aminotransferase [Flavobacteriales bacterium TMED288]|nr:aspartate aminotransferase [Flavobacteriales bacterium]RPG52777.1 MAG: pyridoxal phosphate-dependent aminotransferase [Flavobacteriales bacterium TMED288]
MKLLSNKIQNLEESQTLAMARKSRELINQGLDIISLSLGEPDFNTPDFIKNAAKKAIDNNFSHYTPVPGMKELRDSISKKFKRDNNLNYTSEEIVVSTGAKQSLAQLMTALLNPGDEVIIPCPYWVSYYQMIKMNEGIPVKIETDIENDYKVKPNQIKSSITSKTKAFLFSSPCNPSGSVYSLKELEEISNIFSDFPNIIIISDEIYEHICFNKKHESIGQFNNIKNRVVTVNGVSKGFAMTGWRVGYLGAPIWLAKACNKIQGQITSATCSIAQKATEAALKADPKCTKEMNFAFKRRRDLLINELRKIKKLKINIPEGAFYIFPNVNNFFDKSYKNFHVKNSNDLSMYLLKYAHVSTVPGIAFGNNDCIRISYAASDEILIDAASRIRKYLNLLT